MKQSVIISNKHGMYELPNELPNDLRLEQKSLEIRKLGKIRKFLKKSWNYNLVPSLPPKKKILSIIAKDSLKKILNFSRSMLKSTRVCLKYFVPGCDFENGRFLS